MLSTVDRVFYAVPRGWCHMTCSHDSCFHVVLVVVPVNILIITDNSLSHFCHDRARPASPSSSSSHSVTTYGATSSITVTCCHHGATSSITVTFCHHGGTPSITVTFCHPVPRHHHRHLIVATVPRQHHRHHIPSPRWYIQHHCHMSVTPVPSSSSAS